MQRIDRYDNTRKSQHNSSVPQQLLLLYQALLRRVFTIKDRLPFFDLRIRWADSLNWQGRSTSRLSPTALEVVCFVPISTQWIAFPSCPRRETRVFMTNLIPPDNNSAKSGTWKLFSAWGIAEMESYGTVYPKTGLFFSTNQKSMCYGKGHSTAEPPRVVAFGPKSDDFGARVRESQLFFGCVKSKNISKIHLDITINSTTTNEEHYIIRTRKLMLVHSLPV